MFGSSVHFCVLGKFEVAFSKWYLCVYLMMYLCRCLIGPLYGVLDILPFQKFFVENRVWSVHICVEVWGVYEHNFFVL